MVALSEVLFVVGRYLPVGFLVAFFGSVPLALLSRRRGLKVGAVAAVAALLLILILGGPSGLLSRPRTRSAGRSWGLCSGWAAEYRRTPRWA